MPTEPVEVSCLKKQYDKANWTDYDKAAFISHQGEATTESQTYTSQYCTYHSHPKPQAIDLLMCKTTIIIEK